MENYCCHLGDCDEEVCQCDLIRELEAKQERQANIKMSIVFGLFLTGLFLAIIW